MKKSNCTVEEFAARRRELAAAMQAGIRAPERSFPVLSAGAATACSHAEDTGERAFVNLPCRGNRIICRRVAGLTTFAANCRPEKCKYFITDKESEDYV